jgi:hypothetical protein
MFRDKLPATSKRVRLHTKDEINKKIQERTHTNIDNYRNKSNEEIISRIKELNKEWDTERALETNASIVILISVVFYFITRSNGWIIFIGVISGFLLQHALQGWCPPLPIFRRLGIRTTTEIDEEKYRLKELIKK